MRSLWYALAAVVLSACGGCLHAGDEVNVTAQSGQHVRVDVSGPRQGVLARLRERRANPPTVVAVPVALAVQPAAVAPAGILTIPVAPAAAKPAAGGNRIQVEVK